MGTVISLREELEELALRLRLDDLRRWLMLNCIVVVAYYEVVLWCSYVC